MEIDVTELRMGDEFLYSAQGTIARAKVIRPVVPKKIQPSFSRYLNKVFYKAVKCEVAMIEKSYTTNWGGIARTWKKKEYCASDNYTTQKFIDLNYKNIWLIKREDE